MSAFGEPVGTVVAEAVPSLRLMTYNVRLGIESSLDIVADVIANEWPDLAAVQELDVGAPRTGGIDQPRRLGQLAGMAAVFGKAMELAGGGHYGVALLSRMPILATETRRLDSGNEPRVLLLAEVRPRGREPITVGVTHFGLDPAERRAQAAQVAEALAGRRLAVLLGDLNDVPGSTPLETLGAVLTDVWPLVGEHDGGTYHAAAPSRRIDYVMLGRDWPRPLRARVLPTRASDHRPLTVDVALPMR